MSVAGAIFAVAMMFQGIDDTGTAVARPIGDVMLEPTTGSYFQIFEFYGRPPHTWEHAQRMVRGYRYKEREGRLAHVKTGAVHYFLLLNFLDLRAQKTWIGLSAECNEKSDIRWIDGSDLGDQDFRAWNQGTARKISRTCNGAKETGRVLPVYYDSDEFGLRWEAGDARTNLKYMLVEFVEEKPEENVEDEAAEGDSEAPSDDTESTEGTS